MSKNQRPAVGGSSERGGSQPLRPYEKAKGVWEQVINRRGQQFGRQALADTSFAVEWADALQLAAEAEELAAARRFLEATASMWDAIEIADLLELPSLIVEAAEEVAAACPLVAANVAAEWKMVLDAAAAVEPSRAVHKAVREVVRAARHVKAETAKTEAEARNKAGSLIGAAGGELKYRPDRRFTTGHRPEMVPPPANKPDGNGRKSEKSSSSEQNDIIARTIAARDAGTLLETTGNAPVATEPQPTPKPASRSISEPPRERTEKKSGKRRGQPQQKQGNRPAHSAQPSAARKPAGTQPKGKKKKR